MATAKVAVGSVFGVVAAVSESVTSVVESIAVSADSLKEFALQQQFKQREDYANERATYAEVSHARAAMEITEHLAEIQKFRSQSETNAILYDEASARIKEARAAMQAAAEADKKKK